MKRRHKLPFTGPLIGALLLLVLCAGCAEPEVMPERHPAAIASAHPLATQAGLDILAAGACIRCRRAVGAALAGWNLQLGLGGGGFWHLSRH
jgi:gamma-glutamyltranspeptidase/glutathione hydrolase